MSETIGVILLAGGIGSRMQSKTPKQFLTLNNKPIAQHSLDLFSLIPEVSQIVLVCAPEFHHLFASYAAHSNFSFAEPGARRQDSVYNGLQALSSSTSLVCVHDAARPYLTLPIIERVIAGAKKFGASAAAMPVKFTVKEADVNGIVLKTPDRSVLREIQTPQAIRYSLLHEGFTHADRYGLTVTDDVSLVEHLGAPVQLVEGCYRNIKITTPDDLKL